MLLGLKTSTSITGRWFSGTIMSSMPRSPIRPVLPLALREATPESLTKASPASLTRKPSDKEPLKTPPTVHAIPPQPPGKRSLSEVQMSVASLRAMHPGTSVAADKEKKFFQITLMRSLIGLPAKTRRSVSALGLSKRHQVVWQPFTSPVVGTLLKVKELVIVELVSDIPPKLPTPKGFVKLGNAIGRWASA